MNLRNLSETKSITLAKDTIDDVLTYALFPQVGLKFLENRGNPDAFEPVPGTEEKAPVAAPQHSEPEQSHQGTQSYSVRVDGKVYQVEVAESGALESVIPVNTGAEQQVSTPVASVSGEPLNAPLSGNIFKVLVKPGQSVAECEVVIIMEAMKMETEIRATSAGTVVSVEVNEGDSIQSGQVLIMLG